MLDFVSVDVKESEMQVLGELSYHLWLTRKIEYVSLIENQIWRCQFLVNCTDKPVLSAASPEFKDVDMVLLINIKISNALADGLRSIILDVNAEEIMCQAIFSYKIIK